MAPTRQFDLAKSLRPHTEKPGALDSSSEYSQDDHHRHEEQAQDDCAPEPHLVAKDEEDAGCDGRGPWEEPATPSSSRYGLHAARNDQEATIDHYLRAPNVIPMVWKCEPMKLTQDEALEMYQPIADKFEASYATANVRAEVRSIFTKITIRALPPLEKRLVKLNADLHGDFEVSEWIPDEREDVPVVEWEERRKVANVTDKQVDDLWADLDHLSFNSSVYLASRMDPRIAALKTLFNEQKRIIEEQEQQLAIHTLAAEAGAEENARLDLVKQKKTKRAVVKKLVKGVFCLSV